MTAPDRLADRPWWRWDVRLAATGLDTSTPQPDLFDPLLPGWLLHLLRERTGNPHASTAYVQQFRVWVAQYSTCSASGPTEIAALVAALDATEAR